MNINFSKPGSVFLYQNKTSGRIIYNLILKNTGTFVVTLLFPEYVWFCTIQKISTFIDHNYLSDNIEFGDSLYSLLKDRLSFVYYSRDDIDVSEYKYLGTLTKEAYNKIKNKISQEYVELQNDSSIVTIDTFFDHVFEKTGEFRYIESNLLYKSSSSGKKKYIDISKWYIRDLLDSDLNEDRKISEDILTKIIGELFIPSSDFLFG